MSYTPTTWTQGVTPLNATNMNHLETQYTEASLSFGPDFFTAGFVVSGLVATKDGTIANQLDVTAGTAYLLQSADNTVRQRKPVASNQTTSALSSTYNLYLQPDGTWYWSTSNAPAANSLYVAQVTTDGSGNISVVTDKRPLNATLLPNMLGGLNFPGNITSTVAGVIAMGPAVSGNYARIYWTPSIIVLAPPASGVANGVVIQSWDGAASHNPLSVGGQFGLAPTWVGNTGNIGAVAAQATAGNFGVPTIVAQVIHTHITVNTNQVILSYTPAATGLYRVSLRTAATTGTPVFTVQYNYHDPDILSTSEIPYTVGQGASPPAMSSLTGVANAGYSTIPNVIYADTTAAIVVNYRNAAATVSDWVSAIIERLA